jgi:hypothetical protein
MDALLIVSASDANRAYDGSLDSFYFSGGPPNAFGRPAVAASHVLLAKTLMAWNRDEGVSFPGHTAAAAGAPASSGDEATFRALLVRQLQGLLGGGAKPVWRKNHRGDHSLHLD